VVSEGDVEAALGDQPFTRWDFEHNDWALARQAAAALYADYAMIVERTIGYSRGDIFFEVVLVNATTGKRFGVSLRFLNRTGKKWPPGTTRAAYRELFKDAKTDLLATAIRKSRVPALKSSFTLPVPYPEVAQKQVPSVIAKTESPAVAKPQEEKESLQKERERAEQERLEREKAQAFREKQRAEQERAEQEKMLALKDKEKAEQERTEQEKGSALKEKSETAAPAAVTQSGSRIVDMESALAEDTPAQTGERLLVYDLETSENLKPTALILSESLREELFKFRRFSLVNRENMLQLMDELKFQQSGLVDEKQVVQLGQGMAANQIVTGMLGSLGGSYILQAKRIDVQSLGTKALGSLKCKQGEEERLLEQLPDLAKRLAEGP
jgi:hypothetical protein